MTRLLKVSLIIEIPTRLKVAVLLFFSCFVMYMLRVNLSLLMIAMLLEESNVANWSKKEQSLVIGGYFYGYLTTSLVASIIVRRYSSKDLIGLSIFFSGIITGLSVYTVRESIIPFFITRFLLGALAGFIQPSVQDLITRWSPPEEKGKFVFTLLGGNFGIVATLPTLGSLIEKLDWKSGFHISGMISMIFAVIWFNVVSDSPSNHPNISKEELEYIQSSMTSLSKCQDQKLPIIDIFTSVPFFALLLLHFGNLFGMFFLITATPRFMTDHLKFKLSDVGWLASLPYLMRCLCGFMFGLIGDYQRVNHLLSVTTIRKFYCIFCKYRNNFFSYQYFKNISISSHHSGNTFDISVLRGVQCSCVHCHHHSLTWFQRCCYNHKSSKLSRYCSQLCRVFVRDN